MLVMTPDRSHPGVWGKERGKKRRSLPCSMLLSMGLMDAACTRSWSLVEVGGGGRGWERERERTESASP